MTRAGDRAVTLVLGGDVMLGRGIDQLLAHPGDSALWESGVHDARTYVALAERVCGPDPDAGRRHLAVGRRPRRPRPTRPWRRASSTSRPASPRSDDFAPGKAVHYRMNPDNLGCLLAARPDVCVLANNHVLDFGRRGLDETLDVLGAAGLPTAGAGRDAAEALARRW